MKIPFLFKQWQFWLRLLFSPVGWLLKVGDLVGQKISGVFDWMYTSIDDMLPKIPQDKRLQSPLDNRFGRQSKD